MDFDFSNLGLRLGIPSAVNELTADYASDFRPGIDINLGVGYVNDDTIPYNKILKALKHITKNPENYKSAFNYGAAEGSVNLKNAIKNYYLQNKIGKLTPTHFKRLKIIIGANGATSLLDVISDIVKPGVIITTDPFYYIYTDSLKRKGFSLKSVSEDKNGIILKSLKEAIYSEQTGLISLIYIVTVNNPTGNILSNERRKEIVNIVHELSEKENRKIPLIFDKAYEDIIHDKNINKPVSGLLYDNIGLVFEIGTLSKVLAPALRIGYLLSYDHNFCDLIIQRTSDIGFSAPLMNQEIAAYLLENHIKKQKKWVNKGYRLKSKKIKELFKRELNDFLEDYSGGSAGFYFYLTLKGIQTTKESKFYKFLTRTTGDKEIDGYPEKKSRLVYIPGEICSLSNKAKYQLRISYGFENLQQIIKAIFLIKEACIYSLSSAIP